MNRAFASLRRAFTKSESSAMAGDSKDVSELSVDDGIFEYSESSLLSVEEVKVSHSALLSKYLEDYQLISENSLCKRMMKIASIKPIIFSANQSLMPIVGKRTSENKCRSDLEEVTNLLAKLKMYLSRKCRR